jgi:hypothetical protein
MRSMSALWRSTWRLQGGRRVEQPLALGALAPPECLCLPGELAGALGLLGGEPAVLGELVLEPQGVRGGPGIEGVQCRAADSDGRLQAIGAQARGAFARVFQQRFDCPCARFAERGAVPVRHARGPGPVCAAGKPEALLGAFDGDGRAPVVAVCERVLGRRAERLGAGDLVVEAVAGECGDRLLVDTARRRRAGLVAKQRGRPGGRLGDRRFDEAVADRLAVVARGGDRVVQAPALDEELFQRTDLSLKPGAQGV